MLFSPFTWTQFFVAVITLTSLYYLYVLLWLYRAALISLFKRIARPAIPLASAHPGSAPDDPMGKVSSVSQFSLSDPSTIDFADDGVERSTGFDNKAGNEQTSRSDKQVCPAASIGEIADFTEELKIVFQALGESGGDENLFNMLFSSLVDRYPGTKTSASRKALDVTILRMSAGVPALNLSQNKLNELWDKNPA